VQKEITTIDYLNAADKFWLGEQLNAARLLRGLDIPAAARQLDLSQAQVMAIETGSQGPFFAYCALHPERAQFCSLHEYSPFH